MLPIQTHGNKYLQDNPRWAGVGWRRRLSRACGVERCLMWTLWLVPLRQCLGSCAFLALLWEMQELVCHFSSFLLDLLYGSPFLLWMKNCQDYFLEKLNAIWKLNRSLQTWHISMNNTMLLFQWPHPDHTRLWYLSWRHCRSQEGSFTWLKDMKPLFLGLFGL